MALVFEDAEAVIDNPWTEAVDAIAGKFTESGKPKALKTTIVYPTALDGSDAADDSDAMKAYQKLLRDANKAGREHNPPVTVHKDVSDVKTREIETGRGANKRTVTEKYVVVTIYTTPQILRPRNKNKTASAPVVDEVTTTETTPDPIVPAAEFTAPE
jgi:hypothetical protein